MGKKRKAVVEVTEELSEPSELEFEDSGSDDTSESDMSDEEATVSQSEPEPDESSDSDKLVNVDFEFFDPKSTDYHGVKALLKLYLDDTVWDVGGLVDIVLAQTTVGTVVKTSDEDTPIGIITVLNIGRYADSAAIKQVREFLLTQSGRHRELLAIKESEVGLIVSERLVNVPIDLVQPLHQGLFDEVAWATEDEPTSELKDAFKFKQYLILTRVFEEVTEVAESSGKGKGKAAVSKKKKEKENANRNGAAAASHDELIYIKPEDEIFHELSSWSLKFPVQAASQASRQSKGMKQWRLVMAVAANKITEFLTKLKELAQS